MPQKRPAPPSLDLTGLAAAIYPSEDQLWVSGPPINAPGDQRVAPADGNAIPDAHAAQSEPIALPNPAYQAAIEDQLHEQLNGETSNHYTSQADKWVNTQEYGPTGYGPYNQAPFESGHSQILLSNPAEEQGWGVGPARRWAHYPTEDNPNPFRNRMIHLRNGALPWVTESSYLYQRAGLAWEQQFDAYKQRNPVAPVVGVPPSVPFVNTVPTYGGGAIPHPGVDVPSDDNLVFGGYYP